MHHPRDEKVVWHQKTAEETMKKLGSSISGISVDEAAARLEKYGPNALKEKPKRGALALFFDQFKDFMILVLIAAAVVSGAIGELLDTFIILAIVFLNAVMGFIQENRAQKAMEALKKMAAPYAVAIRDGQAERRSLVTMGIRSNLPLLYAVLLTTGLQLATIYLPFMNRIFHTVPLTPTELAAAFALSTVVFLAVEVEKLIRRNRST